MEVECRGLSSLQKLRKVRTCLAAKVEWKSQSLRADTEDSETWPEEGEPAASTSQQQHTSIVLPQRTCLLVVWTRPSSNIIGNTA